MDLREIKGRQLAATARLQRKGDRWYVPARHGYSTGVGGFYVVDPNISNPQCTCEDHTTNGKKCKHIWAVEFRLRENDPDVEEQLTFDDVVIRKPTYKQEWTAYNAAQTNEKDLFQTLLRDLCAGIGEPSQKKGRPQVAARRNDLRDYV